MKMVQTEIKNPFNKITQEADYLNYEAGFHSKSENDNPYIDSDDPEFKAYSRSWKKGFKANLEHSKVTTTAGGPEVLHVARIASEPQFTAIESISTELLELELKKRKLVVMREYLELREDLYSKLQLLQSKIDKLAILTGES
jgi:hypothetical protein